MGRQMFTPCEFTKEKINADIDFAKVNEIKGKEQNFAFNFLQEQLNNPKK